MPNNNPPGSNVNPDENPLQSLITITGLSEPDARRLLVNANGDLQVAVERHFQPVISSPTRNGILATNRLPLQSVLTHFSLNLGNLVSSALSGVFMFLRGLFVPRTGSPRASAFTVDFRNSLVNHRGETPEEIVNFAGGSITQVVSQATNASRPCCVLAIDSLSLHRPPNTDLQLVWAQVLSDRPVMEALNSQCINHGFDINAALSNKLVARMLQWEASAVVAVSLLLPLRLSPLLANRYKRLLQNDTSTANARAMHDQRDNFGHTDSTWTTAEQESLFESIQTRFLTLSSTPDECPTVGSFSLDIVRGGVLQCYKLSLCHENVPHPDVLKESLLRAIRAATLLAEPISEKRDEARRRAQRDRELRAAQDWEYENSLRADRERLRREQEERDREAALCREREEALRKEQEELNRKEALAREVAERMLRAESILLPGHADSDFASILLRVAPANERLRLRVHKDITIQRLEDVIEKLDHMLKTTDGCVWVRPTSSALGIAAACEVEGSSDGPQRTRRIPAKFTLRPALGGQPFERHWSIEQCGLLPNAVVHVHPLE